MARNASSSSSSSNSIRWKHGDGKKTKYEDEEDKISKLPDEILDHILSIIPTRDAVRTSILSPRWRYVWISVPCIELNDYRPFRHKSGFPDLVDKVLRLKEMHCLRKFSLCWNGMFNASRVNEWISNAITGHSVEVLELVSNHWYEFPHSIFTSKKLVSLTLGWRATRLNVPVSVCLPSLKNIHLRHVRLCNDDSIKNLLDGCPVLEELYFDDCVFVDEMTTLFVRSFSLKRLYFSRYFTRNDDSELPTVVDAPNLQLLIWNKLPGNSDVKELSSFAEVRLALDSSPGSVGYDIYRDKLLGFMEKITTIKSMMIYSPPKGSPPQAVLDTLPTFRNLTDLYMRGDTQHGGRELPCLLECSPNLKNLRYCESYRLQCREPKCLMLHLEKIRIEEFKGGPAEMKMVAYFLKNAPVLKKMSIMSFSNSKEDPKILEKVSGLPRTSTVCQIEYQGFWEYYAPIRK